MDKKYFCIILMFSILFVVGILGMNFVEAGRFKACNDGIDNDGDGFTDYPNDPGCSSKNDKSELNTNFECDDGIDNDGDGLFDMNDLGCSSPTDVDESNCGDNVCEGAETSYNCPADCGYVDSCSDSDSGNFPYIFGVVSGYLNNIFFSNEDYCVDSSNVVEYYCDGTQRVSQENNCGTDSSGENYCSGNLVYQDFTDYFCGFGECDFSVTSVLQQDCDTSDGYDSSYCMNGSVYKDYNDYSCSNGGCVFTSTPEILEACSYGCLNATCNSTPDSCSDSDGGFEVFSFGIVTGYLDEVFFSESDYCFDNFSVVENYCVNDYAYQSTFGCINQTFCYQGSCI